MDPLTRILIVEDNADDEFLLLRQLRTANLDSHVKVIADGEEAFNYLTDARYRCQDLVAIFLDLQLPSMSGLRLLEAIRSVERIRHLPVILMTSAVTPQDLAECRHLGISSCVTKPVSVSTFTKAVADMFHNGRDFTATPALVPEY